MVRTYCTLLLALAGFLLAGCPGPATEKPPIWKNVKIGDLAPHGATGPNQPSSDIINLNIYVFEIPADDANALDNIWPALYTQTLRFNSYNAFAMNLFAAGFGQPQDWNRIADILRNANAKRVERDSLILSNGQPKDLLISSLDSQKTIFYTSIAHESEGVTVGPGTFTLRIKMQKIPGQRGVCNMSVQPVFVPPRKFRLPLQKETEATGSFEFDALGVNLQISPGSFLLLGPKRYTADQSVLAGLFFSTDVPRPAAKLYLFVCGEIPD
jgi:hypothetical protein